MKNKPLSVLITSGPTQEYMDPVRFLSNPSSGTMGAALSKAFGQKGCTITVVSGPCSAKYYKKARIVNVVSARQMFSEVKKHWTKNDIFIGAAAVSDFRFAKISKQKIKKNRFLKVQVSLLPNPDILKWVGLHKHKNKIVIGFALETGNPLQHAKTKLRKKNLDLIVGNTPRSFRNKKIEAVWITPSRAKKLKSVAKEKLGTMVASWAMEKYKRLSNR